MRGSKPYGIFGTFSRVLKGVCGRMAPLLLCQWDLYPPQLLTYLRDSILLKFTCGKCPIHQHTTEFCFEEIALFEKRSQMTQGNFQGTKGISSESPQLSIPVCVFTDVIMEGLMDGLKKVTTDSLSSPEPQRYHRKKMKVESDCRRLTLKCVWVN